MNILIVGGGRVGETLAAGLAREHDITMVEASPNRARELSESLDVHIVEGNGATAPVLRRAGIEGARIVVATTESDECNFVVGQLAAGVFHTPRIVVRLRDPDHLEGFTALSREHPDIVTVNPEGAAVDHILSLLEVPGALEVGSFMDGALRVAGFRIDARSDFVGLGLAHVQLLFAGTATLVAAIHRGEEWIIPHGGEEIRAGDLVYFAIPPESLEGVVALVGALHERRRHIMVAGATRIGLELARRLEGRQRVTLIEPDPELARSASEALGEALVVQGRVTNQELLEEEEIARVATFVSATPDHETNLVACLLAKRLGVGRSFALVDNPALATHETFRGMGIDAVISPRLLAVGLIQRSIRGGRLRSVAALLEEKVEVLEADVAKGGPLTEGPIAGLGLPRGVLVAAVRRDGRLLVPTGKDRIEAGDRVLLIATTECAPKLASFLGQ
jgi:trk system potassium uptake protein TrkA